MVKIYSTPHCPYCITLKEYLKEHDIRFEDIDVLEDKKALEDMIAKSGQMGVPVIEIDGNIIVGFDKAKVNELLDIQD